MDQNCHPYFTVLLVQGVNLVPVIGAGTLIEPAAQMGPEKLQSRITMMLMAFFMTVFALFTLMMSRVTKKLPSTPSEEAKNTQEFSFDASTKEEFRPPSPTPSFKEAEVINSVLKRLGELEEKVDTLNSKPSTMPYEKEELLNAAVCRVDALEAELIATKKVNIHRFNLIQFIWLSFLLLTHNGR